jgi:flagellar export protein FliJ
VKKYQFKLQRLLDLKKIREQEIQRELGEELRVLNEHERELQDRVQLKGKFEDRFRDVSRSGRLDPFEFRRYQGYQITLSREIAVQEEKKAEQNKKVDGVRDLVRLARRKTQAFEKLEEASKQGYYRELQREDLKTMSEVAIQRFRRPSEHGQGMVMVMALGSIAFLFSVLTIGLLFAVGSLSPHRLELIGQILRYRGDQWNEPVRIVGDEKPYLMTRDDYDALDADAKKWRLYEKGQLDDTIPVTKEVLDHRRELLALVETSLERMHKETLEIQGSIFSKETQIAEKEKALQAKQEALIEEVSGREKAKRDAAQQDILQAFNSMDPQDVVNVLTAGREINEYPSVKDQIAAVSKVTEYVSKMGARQRAGILQALSPDWATRVVEHLEKNYPL